MPTRGWYTLPEGVDMENNGAVPDVLVSVTPEDEVRRRRPQLDAAIQATLEQINQARPDRNPRPGAEP
jgi:tricorn protease